MFPTSLAPPSSRDIKKKKKRRGKKEIRRLAAQRYSSLDSLPPGNLPQQPETRLLAHSEGQPLPASSTSTQRVDPARRGAVSQLQRTHRNQYLITQERRPSTPSSSHPVLFTGIHTTWLLHGNKHDGTQATPEPPLFVRPSVIIFSILSLRIGKNKTAFCLYYFSSLFAWSC